MPFSEEVFLRLFSTPQQALLGPESYEAAGSREEGLAGHRRLPWAPERQSGNTLRRPGLAGSWFSPYSWPPQPSCGPGRGLSEGVSWNCFFCRLLWSWKDKYSLVPCWTDPADFIFWQYSSWREFQGFLKDQKSKAKRSKTFYSLYLLTEDFG